MYIYDPPLTDAEKVDLTGALIEDLVYRTSFLSPKIKDQYIQQLKSIWCPQGGLYQNLPRDIVKFLKNIFISEQ